MKNEKMANIIIIKVLIIIAIMYVSFLTFLVFLVFRRACDGIVREVWTS